MAKSTPRRRPSAAGFPAETIKTVCKADEIRIVTQGTASGPARKTTIWVVCLGRRIYVRSFRGRRGRWYRDIVANPLATVHTGRRRIPVQVIRETAATTIPRVSAAYRRKYGRRWPDETAPMVRPEAQRTTLRLLPA